MRRSFTTLRRKLKERLNPVEAEASGSVESRENPNHANPVDELSERATLLDSTGASSASTTALITNQMASLFISGDSGRLTEHSKKEELDDEISQLKDMLERHICDVTSRMQLIRTYKFLIELETGKNVPSVSIGDLPRPALQKVMYFLEIGVDFASLCDEILQAWDELRQLCEKEVSDQAGKSRQWKHQHLIIDKTSRLLEKNQLLFANVKEKFDKSSQAQEDYKAILKEAIWFVVEMKQTMPLPDFRLGNFAFSISMDRERVNEFLKFMGNAKGTPVRHQRSSSIWEDFQEGMLELYESILNPSSPSRVTSEPEKQKKHSASSSLAASPRR